MTASPKPREPTRDTNSERIADCRRKSEILRRNRQLRLKQGDPGWTDPGDPSAWSPVFGPGGSADSEPADSDGPSGPMPPMAAAGDGLSALQEYRGFLLDGGPGLPSPGAHRRLSAARKDLLVECSEATGIKDPANNGAGTNPAISAYDFAAMMDAVSQFYRDENRGAAIDLHWCRDSFEPIGNAYHYAANPQTKYDAFFENGQAEYTGAAGINPDPTTTGGNTIYRDEKWFNENQIAHDAVYGGSAGTSVLKQSRDDDRLGKFVKLFLGHRRTKVVPDGAAGRKLRIMRSLAATFEGNASYGFEHTGSWVYVSGIADEKHWDVGQPLYNAAILARILDYSVAHELGHLIIDAHGAPGWSSDEHTNSGNGSLMAHPPIMNLGVLRFTAEEIRKINLPERVSVFRP